MRSLLKNIIGIKRLIVRKKGKNIYVDFRTKIKNPQNIIMHSNSRIHRGCNIDAQNGILELKENSYISENTRLIVNDGKVTLSKNSFINNDCEIISLGNIVIGKDVLIGPKTLLISGNHCFSRKDIPINKQGYSIGDIEIKDNVWIGAGCIILSGVKIEEGAIVAAGSVVTKDINKNEIWGGNPAKLLKNR